MTTTVVLIGVPALEIRTESRVARRTTLSLKQVVRNFSRLSANLIEINGVLYPSKQKPLTH